MSLRQHDLEAPYQDACAREERYQEIKDNVEAILWRDISDTGSDDMDSEKFIYDYVADPAEELAKFAQHARVAFDAAHDSGLA